MTSTEFVYCPKKLHVAINGEAYDDRLTREVLDNLLHQNILLRCYAQGRRRRSFATSWAWRARTSRMR